MRNFQIHPLGKKLTKGQRQAIERVILFHIRFVQDSRVIPLFGLKLNGRY
jgi:hypothetical protein